MEPSVKSEKTCMNPEVKEMVSLLKNVFVDLSKEASISSMLMDVNIQDGFSKRISDMMDKPLASSFDALLGVESAIKEILNNSVAKFLEANSKNIKNVYRLRNSGSVLHYSILFKNDDLHKRAILYNFISDYKNSNISDRFPIVFQSIPSSLEGDFQEELLSEEKYETIL